jgi:3-oxoacyl-ACP reductase-like protein
MFSVRPLGRALLVGLAGAVFGAACGSTTPAASAVGSGALTGAGAYGAVMSSTYNSRLLVPEVLASGSRFAVIRARPSHEAMLGLDTVPDFLADPLSGPRGEPARKRGAA